MDTTAGLCFRHHSVNVQEPRDIGFKSDAELDFEMGEAICINPLGQRIRKAVAQPRLDFGPINRVGLANGIVAPYPRLGRAQKGTGWGIRP